MSKKTNGFADGNEWPTQSKGTLRQEIDRAKSIFDEAMEQYQPIAIFAGFSGGYDSLVATHFAISHESTARPLHLNTGIGIEKTREFVRRTSGEFGWRLWEEKTPESYEDIVLGRCYSKDGTKLVYPGGFPGPPMHGFMYNRLKQRPLESVMRQVKADQHRHSTVLIVTGIRHDESAIRAGYKRAVSKVGSQVWVNPFYWATVDHFREYRKTYSLPTNPVKDKCGLSGECLCGAHADKGELVKVRAACPETADYLEGLEKRVREAGFPWGYEDRAPGWWLQEKRDERHGQGTLWDSFNTSLEEAAIAEDWDEYDRIEAWNPRDPLAMAEACKPGPMCHSCEKFSAGISEQ